ncbi:TetR/AcrR family transcriptional regulator [Mycobacterium sp. ACS4331]|uniref:TetR/AcrR family transcriptional regulator n=1 Tax=Mycobacterium sp. ACS4331 TaxID=1834121 RepID=UPI0007FE5ED8|nr:TetR/AcrR family transcriptional regulator [Mycobacterium sp. ACS4331]OBF26161.1 TetR family transcriptional regulator [Mycobacterium sp. ACS4331]
MAQGRTDPRPARSRARLLEAATTLLRSGGPSAVTVDAVLRGANVARATLYRHFPSGTDLLAAAFQGLIPPPPMPPDEGTLRERLVALMEAWAQHIADAPALLTAMNWLALGRDLDEVPEAGDSPEVRTLRERIAQQYAAPFDAVFDSPQAMAELGDFDRTTAMALLLGPLVTAKLSTLVEADYHECVRVAVEGFLHVYGAKPATGAVTEISAASTESAGA